MLRIYLEELLNGFVNFWHGGRATVYEVETREEFMSLLDRNDELRGLVVDGKLYVTPDRNAIHLDMMVLLKRNLGIQFGVTLDDTIYDEMNDKFKKSLKRFLLVQMNNGSMYFGESYYYWTSNYVNKLLKTPETALNKTDLAVKNALNAHIAVIKKFTNMAYMFL